jgi:transcriptional regulator with XRE-family HTH domain
MAKKTNPRAANDIDHFIGERLRAARNLAGLSQQDAAKVCGVSFQQIQKNESGVNRMSAGRLIQLATAYQITIESLFDGAPGYKHAKLKRDVGAEFFRLPQAVEMAEAFIALEKVEDRVLTRNVARALSARD